MSIKQNTTDLQELLAKVNNLPDGSGGVDLPDLANPASASELLNNKQLIDEDGNIVTGTMPDNGTLTYSLNTSTTSYTIPKGYHSGSGNVSITTETKTVTPAKSSQSVTPTSGKVLSKVTVNAIPGEYITTTDATADATEIIKGETAYVNGSKVTGTFSLDSELSTQDNLIAQIKTALQGKASGSGGIGSTASVNLSGTSIYFSYIDETGVLRDGLEIAPGAYNILAPSFVIARASSGQFANVNIGGNCRLLYNTFVMAIFYVEGNGYIDVYTTGAGGGGSASSVN